MALSSAIADVQELPEEAAEGESDSGLGAVEFAALMRKLDRIDPSYRN